MIQRRPSIVIRSETLMKIGFADLYSEEALARGEAEEGRARLALQDETLQGACAAARLARRARSGLRSG